MTEFYDNFAKYVAEAENEAICICRYRAPTVWLVGHGTWARHPKIEQFVPHAHSLVTLRELVDVRLAGEMTLLCRLVIDCKVPISPEPVIRALLIRVLYSVLNDEVLHIVLTHNLLYRLFVGFNLSEPLWPLDVMQAAATRLLANREVVDLIAALIECAESVAQPKPGLCDFDINHSLLEAWRVRVQPLALPVPPVALLS